MTQGINNKIKDLRKNLLTLRLSSNNGKKKISLKRDLSKLLTKNNSIKK